MFHVKHLSSLITSSFAEVVHALDEQDLLTRAAPQLPSDAVEKLATYLSLLESWTKKLDLVGPGDPELLVERHLSDGFAAWLLLSEGGFFVRGETLDVGSGAGLPGVVFACLSPAIGVVLCEPREKRVVFLQEVKRRLNLNHCRILKKRVEELFPQDVAGVEAYVFRALTPEPRFIEHFRSIMPTESSLAFMTGAQAEPGKGVTWDRHLEYKLPRDTRGRKISFAKITN